ncbi:MAG: hypothetical protein ACR2M0_03705 [Chloroflexia bacterium]
MTRRTQTEDRPRRRLNGFIALNILVGILVGVLVLVGFYAPTQAGVMVRLFGSWTATIIVFAMLLGFANLMRVHLARITAMGSGWAYSAALVISALTVLILGYVGNWSVAVPTVQWIFDWVYQPLGSSLFALLTFFVAAAAFRALHAGPSAAWVVLAVALLVILGTAPWSNPTASFSGDNSLNILADVKNWVINYPALAGLRGILLGTALGAIAVSLRVLFGVDRPYQS